MIVVSGTVPVRGDKLDEVKAVAIKMQDASSAEDGCITYRFYQDLEDPTLFRVFEEWETQEALEAHFKTPHMAEFSSQLPDLVAGPGDITRYEVSAHNKL